MEKNVSEWEVDREMRNFMVAISPIALGSI